MFKKVVSLAKKYIHLTVDKIISVYSEKLYERLLIKNELRTSQESQISLKVNYKLLAKENIYLPLTEVGFRVYSQFEEDGILLYIFSLIGTKNKVVVELGAGDGNECMATNLIINHGWWGYLIDGNEKNVKEGKIFFNKCKDTFLHPPKFKHSFISSENVNDVVKKMGVRGEIDLLSIDIDGMDYWVWKAIKIIKPRVVVIETQNTISHDKSLTVPYDPKFKRNLSDFSGASLAAMTKLSREKGYRLIGTHRFGFNAFFIRKDLGKGALPTVSPKDCLRDEYSKKARKERWPRVKEMDWVKV